MTGRLELELPTRLVQLVDEGWSPTTGEAERAPNSRPLVLSHHIAWLLHGETLFLHRPPFTPVESSSNMDYGTTLSCVRRLSPRPDRPDGPRARTWTIVADDFDAFVAGLGLE